MDKFIKIPQLKDGDKLYHYTNVAAIQGIVNNNEFWVTKNDFLNDKMEFSYAQEVMREVCEEQIKNQDVQKRFLKFMQEENERLMDDNLDPLKGYYVISFSEEKDSALMWAEYSNFVGYSIEFDYEKLITNGIKKKRTFIWDGEVIYNKEQQKKVLKETLDSFIENCIDHGEAYEELKEFYSENPKKKISDDAVKSLSEGAAIFIILYAMFFKKECYYGEKEYRVVISPNKVRSESKDKINYREKEGVLLPYIKVKYKDEEDQSPITSVLVGPKNNSDLAVKGMKYFLLDNNIDVEVAKSDIPLRY